MDALTFSAVTLDQISPWTEAARREDAHLYEGKTPILWFGAWQGETLVGCIGLLAPYRGQTEVRIRGWYVDPAWRGQGIGLYLLRQAVEMARSLGYRRVEMKTKYREIAAKMGGWQPTGRVYNSFGGQETKPGPGYQLIYPLDV